MSLRLRLRLMAMSMFSFNVYVLALHVWRDVGTYEMEEELPTRYCKYSSLRLRLGREQKGRACKSAAPSLL